LSGPIQLIEPMSADVPNSSAAYYVRYLRVEEVWKHEAVLGNTAAFTHTT
jgi:hypothetical protein